MRKRSDIVNYVGLEILGSYRMTPGLLRAHHILMDSNKLCVSPSLLYPKENSWVFIWPFIHCQCILSYYLRNQSWTVIYFPTGRRRTLVISEMWVQLQGHPEESAPPSLALHSSSVSLFRDTVLCHHARGFTVLWTLIKGTRKDLHNNFRGPGHQVLRTGWFRRRRIERTDTWASDTWQEGSDQAAPGSRPLFTPCLRTHALTSYRSVGESG